MSGSAGELDNELLRRVSSSTGNKSDTTRTGTVGKPLFMTNAEAIESCWLVYGSMAMCNIRKRLVGIC